MVTKGAASHTTTNSKAHSQQSQRIYDPLWTNALTFLDYLAERNLIQRDFNSAGIGQIVLSSGKLHIRDLNLIKQAMALPSLGLLPAEGTENSSRQAKRNRARQKAKDPEADPQQKLGIEILSLFPHSVQAQVVSEDGTIWCTLNEDLMSVEGCAPSRGVNCSPAFWICRFTWPRLLLRP